MGPLRDSPPPRGRGDAQDAGPGTIDIFRPDPEAPPLPPAARPGAPLSDALRQQAAELMVEGVAWMEEHWQAARWAGAAVAVGGLAFMLHYGHLSGWRQYASLAELPPRLLAPDARQLPVVLHSVAQHGEVLAVRAAHYPLLRRLLDRYRGLPPAAAAQRAAQHGLLLTCHLAGPVQPTVAGLQYLRAFPLNSPHRLRLLSIVGAAEQTWTGSRPAGAASADATSADATSAEAACPPLALASDSSLSSSNGGSSAGAGSWQASAVGRVAGAPAVAGPAGPANSPQVLASQAERAVSAKTASFSSNNVEQLQTSVQAVEQGDALLAGTAGRPERAQQGEVSMLWGELYAREPRRGLAALLPRRRVDVGERLIAQGTAAMMEPIDLEWLGVSWARIDRLYAAEQAAIEQGLGMWAQRRPSLGEWSASLTRSAWVRVRHAARTSAAAAAGGLGSAASSAGGAVSQASSAAAEKVVQASSAAASSLVQASSAAAEKVAQAAAAARRKAAGGTGDTADLDGAAGGKGWWRRAAAAAGTVLPWRKRGDA